MIDRLMATLLLAPLAAPQTVYPAEPPLDRSYVGPSVEPWKSGLEVYNLFLPGTPPPPGGYPLLVQLELGGFTSAPVADEVDAGSLLPWQALESGWAVILAGCVVSRGGTTGNPVDGGSLGPAYLGNGVFIPPGVELPNYAGGPLHPYVDPARLMPEKDAIMLVQHVKANAGTTWPVDRQRVLYHARSGGAVVLWWVGAGPERKGIWSNPQGQELLSTKIDHMALHDAPMWWPAYSSPGTLVDGTHFPVDPGHVGGLYDVPATTTEQTLPEILLADSPLVFGLDETEAPGITLENHVRAMYAMYSGLAQEKEDFAGPPYPVGTESDIHSSWQGAAWKAKFCNSRFVSYDLGGVGMLDEVDFHAPSVLALEQDILDWAEIAFAGAQVGPWSIDAGTSLAGVAGAPVLRACGSLVAGSTGCLLVSQAPASAGGLLFVGLGALNALFKGGVLVPVPDVALPLITTAQGGLDLTFLWPAGVPNALTLWMQCWFADAQGPHGASATNAIHALTP